MGAEQQIGLIAHSLSDSTAKRLRAIKFLNARLAGIIGPIQIHRIKFQGVKALRNVFKRSRRRSVRVKIEILGGVIIGTTLVRIRIKVGVGAHPRMAQPSKQFVNWHALSLTLNVPKRGFQPTENTHNTGIGTHGKTSGINLAPEVLNAARVHALNMAREHILNHGNHNRW